MQGKILLYGNLSQLLMTRGLVLEKAGHRVYSTSHFEEEVELVAIQKPDVLILCQTLSRDERKSALILAQQLNPEMKTIVMLEADAVYDPEPHNGESLYALDGPNALLGVIERMLSQSNAAAQAGAI